MTKDGIERIESKVDEVLAEIRKMSGPGMTHEERAKRRRSIADDVAAGATTDEVATKYGVAIATVENACAEFGITLVSEPIERPIAESTYDIIAAILKGKSDSAIAGETGLSRQRINVIRLKCREAGMQV